MPIHGEQQEGRKNRKESADYRARLPALRIGHAGETKTHGVADDFASHEGGGIADLQCKTDSKPCKHLASDHQYACERRNTTRWHGDRSEEHTSELQSLMRISYAVFCLKKKTK